MCEGGSQLPQGIYNFLRISALDEFQSESRSKLCFEFGIKNRKEILAPLSYIKIENLIH